MTFPIDYDKTGLPPVKKRKWVNLDQLREKLNGRMRDIQRINDEAWAAGMRTTEESQNTQRNIASVFEAIGECEIMYTEESSDEKTTG